MPQKLNKKPFSMEDALNKMLQPAGMGVIRQLTPRESVYSRHILQTNALFQNWLEILHKGRDLPRTEFRDDMTELRQEIDTLRMTVHSLTQELAASERRVDGLSRKVDELHSPLEGDTITKLSTAYVKMVSTIDIVQKVALVETADIATIWTIIDAPAFEDSLRTPIYDAQLHIFSKLEDHVSLDFNVLNISELSENQGPDSIIPADARIIWER
ncbi:MAG: hypothetical protein J7K94_04205 [Dehalococcoidia bacterium]|nr:hypothetical protein [Dehalococcoidia bacterium]